MRWTCKSLRQLESELRSQWYVVSHTSIGDLLKRLGYSLQGNRKTLESGDHPDRNEQFEFINARVTDAIGDGQPVISAVATIRRWWFGMGKELYPDARDLLITADGGGSNGSRVRLWKLELQKLANELCIPIRVSHFPPGTSKWNKIEHRLFSYITHLPETIM